MRSIIALMTDFSPSDPYIGAMRGVILSINPNALVVDLAHDLPKFNVRYAAFVLYTAYKYFPRGTIFVVVVDPGVGTEREPIVVKTKNYVFVGPNNGVLSLAAEDDGIEEVRIISNREFMLPEISSTFHGRDIFAPTAAHLSLGRSVNEVGPPLPSERFVKVSLGEYRAEDGKYEARIVATDGFGNLITNVPGHILLSRETPGERLLVRVRGKEYEARLVRTYGEVEPGSLVVLVGSHGFVEIAVSMGSAKDFLGVSEGERVVIERVRWN